MKLLAYFYGVRYRLCEAASLRQSFSFPSDFDTRLLRLDEACLITLFALTCGGRLAAAHDGVRSGGGTIQLATLKRGQPVSRARRLCLFSPPSEDCYVTTAATLRPASPRHRA